MLGVKEGRPCGGEVAGSFGGAAARQSLQQHNVRTYTPFLIFSWTAISALTGKNHMSTMC